MPVVMIWSISLKMQCILKPLPASNVVENGVSHFGGSCLIKYVEGFQCFKLLFFMDLMPRKIVKKKHIKICSIKTNQNKVDLRKSENI